MLVISRKINERILIGKDIWISVSYVKGHYGDYRVGVSIEAPKDVDIWREELLDDVADRGKQK